MRPASKAARFTEKKKVVGCSLFPLERRKSFVGEPRCPFRPPASREGWFGTMTRR